MPKINVTLTPEQARLFSVLAKSLGAAPGDLLVALACTRLGYMPQERLMAYDEMAAMLWQFVHLREVPSAEGWLDADEHCEIFGPAGPKSA